MIIIKARKTLYIGKSFKLVIQMLTFDSKTSAIYQGNYFCQTSFMTFLYSLASALTMWDLGHFHSMVHSQITPLKLLWSKWQDMNSDSSKRPAPARMTDSFRPVVISCITDSVDCQSFYPNWLKAQVWYTC